MVTSSEALPDGVPLAGLESVTDSPARLLCCTVIVSDTVRWSLDAEVVMLYDAVMDVVLASREADTVWLMVEV